MTKIPVYNRRTRKLSTFQRNTIFVEGLDLVLFPLKFKPVTCKLKGEIKGLNQQKSFLNSLFLSLQQRNNIYGHSISSPFLPYVNSDAYEKLQYFLYF